jgi:hypothetical protein
LLPDGRDPFGVVSLSCDRGNGRRLTESEWWFFKHEAVRDMSLAAAHLIAERAVQLAHAERLLRDLGAIFVWPAGLQRDWLELRTSSRTCCISDRGAVIFRATFRFHHGSDPTRDRSVRRYYEALTAARCIAESLDPGLGWDGGDASRKEAENLFGALDPVPLDYFGPITIPAHLAALDTYDVVVPSDEPYGRRPQYMRRAITRVVHVDPDVQGTNLGIRVLIDRAFDRRVVGDRDSTSLKLFGLQNPGCFAKASLGMRLSIGIDGHDGSCIGWSGALYPRGTLSPEEMLPTLGVKPR